MVIELDHAVVVEFSAAFCFYLVRCVWLWYICTYGNSGNCSVKFFLYILPMSPKRFMFHKFFGRVTYLPENKFTLFVCCVIFTSCRRLKECSYKFDQTLIGCGCGCWRWRWYGCCFLLLDFFNLSLGPINCNVLLFFGVMVWSL